MKTRKCMNSFRSQRGNTLVVVIVFSLALLITSAAFFRSLTSSRRIGSKSELLLQAREGAEAALGYASAELNKKATSLAAISDNPLPSFALTTAEKDYVAGTSTKTNVVSSSIEVKAGKISSSKTDMVLYDNDPAYAGDYNAGLSMSVRSGYIFAKASAKDPVMGTLTTSYVSGVVQVREQTWLNYGMFYNMDMEFNPGKNMDVKGAIHTNADLYLCAAGANLSFYKKVTAAGHVYKGFKYCTKAYNADGSLTGFENKTGTGALSSGTDGEGSGKVYISKDGSTLVEMTGTMDCLGSDTNPATNLATWISKETSTWNKYVMDVSLSVEKFTPPGLPLYVPENLKTTATTELRNHGYAMIEPQLPATDNRRYYGRKDSDVENLKFSALAGLTIVVEDLDLAADATATGFYNADAKTTLKAVTDDATNVSAIPWKLVWYEGATLANQPLSKDNLPARDGTTLLPTKYEIDPFGRNDEVDKVTDATITVTMRRNLKALLRDAIVVAPYRDTGYTTSTTFGTGTTAVSLSTFPAALVGVSFTPNVPAGTYHTRYNQPACAYPALNITDLTTYNPIYFGNLAGTYPGTNRYPDSSPVTAAASKGYLNTSTGAYSGLYDRRQGYSYSTSTNSGLKGAMHVVYIDLQKLNWIINNSDLWKHPTTGAAIYTFSQSYTNMIYVDLPSKAKDTTRFALTDPDKVCSTASPTSTKPGYCVVLDRGARLPRLTYDESIRTPGFTFATNGPLYIKGNFNADGDSSTGDSLLPDVGATRTNWYSLDNPTANEMPSMVAADAVTFLTESFSFASSNKGLSTDATKPPAGGNGASGSAWLKRYNGYNGDTTTTTASFQEISTAMVCGLVPTIPHFFTVSPYTNPVLIFCGGVNNLPRFLETNSSVTIRYRGSMAALFESEVANSPFIEGPHSYWFAPPTRDWGYHQYLAAGKYPPGTPVLRTTRLISVSDITAAEYATGPSQPP